jgi:hypothetical protein
MKDFQILVMMAILMILIVEASHQLRWFRRLLDTTKLRAPSRRAKRAVRRTHGQTVESRHRNPERDEA